MFIVFPLQQWLHERTLMFLYMYIAYLVCLITLTVAVKSRTYSTPIYAALLGNF
jgi:hypothetical protein